MRPSTFLFGALVTFAAAQPAMAQITEQNFMGGRTSDLAALCGPSDQDPHRLTALAYCQGFFVSAGQFHAALSAEGGTLRPMFCLPNPSPTFNQARTDFVNWVQAHPQYANERAIDGLTRFASEAFPCPPGAATSRRRR